MDSVQPVIDDNLQAMDNEHLLTIRPQAFLIKSGKIR